MVLNKIQEVRSSCNMSQKTLSENLPNADRTMVSLMETGKLLPTPDLMKALCGLFNRKPTDLYKKDDLDLLLPALFGVQMAIDEAIENDLEIEKTNNSHKGKTEFRVWVKTDEKKAIEVATKALGYKSLTDWFREAVTILFKSYKRIERVNCGTLLTQDKSSRKSG